MVRIRGQGGFPTSPQNLGRKMIGTKEINEEKEPDRLIRDSIAAAGSHRRKSQGMIEVVKEGLFPKMCLEPA